MGLKSSLLHVCGVCVVLAFSVSLSYYLSGMYTLDHAWLQSAFSTLTAPSPHRTEEGVSLNLHVDIAEDDASTEIPPFYTGDETLTEIPPFYTGDETLTDLLAYNTEGDETLSDLPAYNTENDALTHQSNHKSWDDLPACKTTMGDLGPVPVVLDPLPWTELNTLFRDVNAGGRWRPQHCRSQYHVGIVIPYRDREAQLRTFLYHMHQFLQAQLLDYSIYVIEQDAVSLFNRGMLMNIGFVEALRYDNYSCFVFSDVDLLPEDTRNIYGCPRQPRHLSVAPDIHNYSLKFNALFGGVENFSVKQFQTINGFSNMYFGWGAEDDDLYRRIRAHGYHLIRPRAEIGRYQAQNHDKAAPSKTRRLVLEGAESRFSTDGLNSLQYDIVEREQRPLYTLISVTINQTTVMGRVR